MDLTARRFSSSIAHPSRRLNQMPLNAVIYARFSSENQAETSIEDQARVCIVRAGDLKLDVDTIFSDSAVSGSTPVAARIGGRAMLEEALAGRFTTLIIEGLDRLSRDQVEQERIVRRLEYRGVRIIGVSDGYDSSAGSSRKLVRGMRGLVNEIYLDDLREKLTGVSLGRSSAASTLADFPAIRRIQVEVAFRLEVDAVQAEIVRGIFERYADGWSCQKVAAIQSAGRARTSWWHLVCLSALWLPGQGFWSTQQRALHRPVCMEPQPMGEGPRHRRAQALGASSK